MWADFGIARIELAAVHVDVIVRLILVGKEIDAYAALLSAVRLELVVIRKNSSGESSRERVFMMQPTKD